MNSVLHNFLNICSSRLGRRKIGFQESETNHIIIIFLPRLQYVLLFFDSPPSSYKGCSRFLIGCETSLWPGLSVGRLVGPSVIISYRSAWYQPNNMEQPLWGSVFILVPALGDVESGWQQQFEGLALGVGQMEVGALPEMDWPSI